MSNIIKKESPLHYVRNSKAITFGSGNIKATEVPFLGYVNLRGDVNDADFLSKVEKIIGLKVPIINQLNRNDEFSIYCLSPDEWMIGTKENAEIELEKNLREALSDSFFAVTNVTGGFTKINMSGKETRKVINKGTSLNVNSEHFKLGQCAQTQFAGTAVLLAPTNENDFEFIIRRSFAEYFWLYLKEASSEFNS